MTHLELMPLNEIKEKKVSFYIYSKVIMFVFSLI